jgi:hypothetical protein
MMNVSTRAPSPVEPTSSITVQASAVPVASRKDLISTAEIEQQQLGDDWVCLFLFVKKSVIFLKSQAQNQVMGAEVSLSSRVRRNQFDNDALKIILVANLLFSKI